MREEFSQPSKVFIGATSSSGRSHINAFDNCLLQLGVGNVSLVKVTSILPHRVNIVSSVEKKLPSGVNVPAIYTHNVSAKEGERIAAAVGIGKTREGPTLVCESTGKRKRTVSNMVQSDLERMAKARECELQMRRVEATETEVNHVSCALAIVAELEFS